MTFKTLGILGGLGPQSTVTFYSKILEYCQKNFEGFASTIFPPMIIFNCNFPPFDLDNRTKVNAKLLYAAKALERGGAETIVIPSNTPHVFYDEIKSSVSIPLINLPQEVLKALQKYQVRRVGILETGTAVHYGLYQKLLQASKIEYVCHEDDAIKIQEAAEHYMNGTLSSRDREDVLEAVDKLKKEHVDKIVLGCTELPFIIGERFSENENLFVDTLDVLLEATMREITI